MEAAAGLTGGPLLEDAVRTAVPSCWDRGGCRAGGGILIACNEVVFLKKLINVGVPENEN